MLPSSPLSLLLPQLALVVCLPSLDNNALAATTIPRIDPPSEGILMERFIPLSLDACLGRWCCSHRAPNRWGQTPCV